MTTHGTSQGDPPHSQPGDRVRYTVEGTMRVDGSLELGDGRCLVSRNALAHGTVEVIAPPLPPIPEEVGVVVRDPDGDLWVRWGDGWRLGDDNHHRNIAELLAYCRWTRADLTIVSLPVPK